MSHRYKYPLPFLVTGKLKRHRDRCTCGLLLSRLEVRGYGRASHLAFPAQEGVDTEQALTGSVYPGLTGEGHRIPSLQGIAAIASLASLAVDVVRARSGSGPEGPGAGYCFDRAW